MRPFSYARARTVDEAAGQGAATGTAFLAGGTTLVDLMKYDVARPARLVDINPLPLSAIEDCGDGGLRLGALATNADTAYDPRVGERYPLLSNAILAGASAQLRNAATNGGNLNQRTRCLYFYDAAAPCNKRVPGTGCGAIGGVNRVCAILGTSSQCIATHPSDMCVALRALDAEVRVTGPDGERVIPFAGYHRLPGDEPWRDNTLRSGELVTAIDLPAERFDRHWTYLKMRDRQSYAFALVSAAVAMRLEGDVVTDVRVALGGVSHVPWRRRDAELLLVGRPPSAALFATVAEALLEGAKGHGGNDVKVALAPRVVIRALTQAAAGTPQPLADKRIA